MTACTDGVPPAAPGAGAGSTTVAHGSSAPAPSGLPRERPGASTPTATSTAGPGAPGRSPAPSASGATPATPAAAPSTAVPSPSVGTGPATGRPGPADDGGEDARVFCSPTALSLVLRVANPPRAGGGSRSGADVRAPGEAVLVARNTSGHTCVLRGFPTLTFTDDAGRPSSASTPAKPFAKPFALHPGSGGVARVHYTARRGCRGIAVRVTLPGSATADSVPAVDAHGRPATLSVCGAAVRVGAFTPGFG
ncbi:DUF4232 domain-containing protein [Streptomyces sp. NPDC006632]|uniref:DUF4232 domain-containing protein n=1 Tax=unclassified Streptomyces TaxID=2593676 RepID=UPI002E249F85